MALTIYMIAALAEGRVKSAKTASAFALVARRNGHYCVEHGRAVPEADEDDCLSYTYHPFTGDRMCPWVGVRVVTLDPAEALALYLVAKEAAHCGGPQLVGEAIGSVSR